MNTRILIPEDSVKRKRDADFRIVSRSSASQSGCGESAEEAKTGGGQAATDTSNGVKLALSEASTNNGLD